MMNIFHNIFLALVPFNAPMELVGFHLGGPSRKITHNIETGTTVRNVGTKKMSSLRQRRVLDIF